jgi:hypothetical protein
VNDTVYPVIVHVVAIVLLLRLPKGEANVLKGNTNAETLVDPADWKFVGCYSSYPDDSDLYVAPSGQTMDADVCTTICSNANHPEDTKYAIIYDTDFCV